MHKNIKIATFLNIAFTVVEFIGGALTNSLAVTMDALHDLGDSIVLLSSWKIEQEALRKPDWKRSYGYRRLSLLAAFLNAVIIFGGSIVILFQVLGRLIKPEPVDGLGIVWIAIIGIIANAIGSWKLKHGHNLNERILSWHLLEDVFGWVGILISGVVIYFTNWYIIDPIVTILFTTFILWGVWRNSKELINVFLEGVPSHQSLPNITHEIEQVSGLKSIQDIHLWSLDGKHQLFSFKGTVESFDDIYEIKIKIERILKSFHINHSTIELSENTKAQEQRFLN